MACAVCRPKYIFGLITALINQSVPFSTITLIISGVEIFGF